MVQFTKRVAAGERLFRAGARQTGIYALRSGFMMTSLPEINGRRFVLRFMLPGDAVGMEAMATGEHPTDASAIEDSEVCVIPVRRAEVLVEFLPAYAAEVRKLLAEQYAEAMAHAILLRRRRADERVALFLLELSRRSLERGFPPEVFPLPMRRYELGEHLNLRFESVSRTLNELQKRGAIEIDGATVKIASLERLREVGGLVPA